MKGAGASAAGWVALAILAFVGAGGVAARPGGLLLGAPPPWLALPLLLLLGLLARVAGLSAARPCLGFLPVPALLVLGVTFPGLAALSGPPLFALALAGAALALSGSGWRPDRRLLFPVALAVYLVVSVRVQEQVGAEGDEPHYLMVAESLLRDRDLSLEQDYSAGRYHAFYHGDHLEPHYRVRGRHGEIYSLHALGLSLLVLPAYALGGYLAASFFMALLAACLAREVRELCRAAGASEGQAEGVGWVVAFSPPLVHFAGLVFTEVPAALGIAFTLRMGMRDPPRPGRALLIGGVIAFLPWLNVRYALLAGLLMALLAIAWRRLTPTLLVALPCVLSAGTIALYHWVLYGFFDPRRVYGKRPEFALGVLPEGLPGLFLDQEFGLFVAAPVFALALPGLLALSRRRRPLGLTCLALLAVVVFTAGAWPMWRGGWNPPARFLVPMIPILALGVCSWLTRGLGSSAALLIGWGVWIGITGAAEPRLVHRDRDGSAPLFRTYGGAEEWTRLLPRYVLAEPDRHRQALIWVGALVLAAMASRRGGPARPTTVLVAGAAFVAAAALASAASKSKAEGREAIRVIGRAALETPGWRRQPVASAVWMSRDLGWGPLYEPHRHPDGALVGGRLALPPGDYCLGIATEVLPTGLEAPILEVRPEPSAHARQSALSAGPDGPEGCFRVLPGERAVSLALRGGGPLVLKALHLSRYTPRVQPFPVPPV